MLITICSAHVSSYSLYGFGPRRLFYVSAIFCGPGDSKPYSIYSDTNINHNFNKEVSDRVNSSETEKDTDSKINNDSNQEEKYNNYKDKKTYNFISQCLSKINAHSITQGLNTNHSSQKYIESVLFDEFDSLNRDNNTMIRSIDIKLLNSIISNYVINNQFSLEIYISNLCKSLKYSKNTQNAFMFKIFDLIGLGYIKSVALHYFLLILNNTNTDNDNNIILLPISIRIGKDLVRKYFYMLRSFDNNKDYNTGLSYSQ